MAPDLPPSANASAPGGDWPRQLTDAIVRVIDKIRSKTTRPAITIARALVFGLVALVIGSIALLLALIGSVRALDRALPGSVWLVYLILGAFFVLTGSLVFGTRHPRAVESTAGRR